MLHTFANKDVRIKARECTENFHWFLNAKMIYSNTWTFIQQRLAPEVGQAEFPVPVVTNCVAFVTGGRLAGRAAKPHRCWFIESWAWDCACKYKDDFSLALGILYHRFEVSGKCRRCQIQLRGQDSATVSEESSWTCLQLGNKHK